MTSQNLYSTPRPAENSWAGSSASSTAGAECECVRSGEDSRQPRVMILCGGQSPEHFVSLSSGRCSAHAMDRERWEVHVGCILQDGRWAFSRGAFGDGETPADISKFFDILEMPDLAPQGYLRTCSPGEALDYLMGPMRPDVIFPVTHGARGEDGTLQGLLEFLGVPYTGSEVMASALAMDKVRASELLEAHGIATPGRVVLGPGRLMWDPERIAERVAEHLGWPVVVKPSRGGSSIATAMASNAFELTECVERAAAIDRTVLIEQRIEGTEVTCGVIEIAGCGCFNAPGAQGAFQGAAPPPEAGSAASGPILHRVICPPTEICPRDGQFFDFDSKYCPGGSEEITPARLAPEVLRRVQEIADRAHTLLGCRGLSRTDMIINAEGEPIFLETNTLPGMTPTSLLPQGARAIGLNITELLTVLLQSTLVSARRPAAARSLQTANA